MRNVALNWQSHFAIGISLVSQRLPFPPKKRGRNTKKAIESAASEHFETALKLAESFPEQTQPLFHALRLRLGATLGWLSYSSVQTAMVPVQLNLNSLVVPYPVCLRILKNLLLNLEIEPALHTRAFGLCLRCMPLGMLLMIE